MTDLNNVTVGGRITSDLQDRQVAYLQNGTCVLNFSIANNKSVQKDGQWENECSFFNCVVFGKAAEKLKEKIRKGLKIVIVGRLEQQSWTDTNGDRKSKVQIIVEHYDVEKTNDLINYDVEKTNDLMNYDGGVQWQ